MTVSLNNDAPPNQLRVITGAQALATRNFDSLKGKRIGLITNHTAKVGDQQLSWLLARLTDVKLGAIFVPEHGLSGTVEAGKSVTNGIDKVTGVPIFSLFGTNLRPKLETLHNLDALVFDIQDIGVRFYTYISTMGLAMQAAAEAKIPFIVLDRPNPLGGDYVAGFVLRPDQRSFVGQYEIPLVHGLTVGELAKLIKGEHLLPGLEQLKLDVVKMNGWQRRMRWPDTGLEWIPTSPNIVDFETALVYPGAGFFEATVASEGRGTLTPFKVVGAPWADGEQLSNWLNSADLPGVRFESVSFVPHSIQGMADHPRLSGQNVHGIRIIVTDIKQFLPVETGVYMLQAFKRQANLKNSERLISDERFFNKLAGNQDLSNFINKKRPASEIISMWQAEVDKFDTVRRRYFLY